MAKSFVRFELPISKEITIAQKPHHIVTCASGGFLVRYRNRAMVSRFDENHNLVWEKEIGDRLNNFNLSISPDGSMIGVNGTDFVRIFDGNGQLLFDYPHFRWEVYQGSDCYFYVGEGGKVSRLLFFEPTEMGDGYLRMFDALNFSLIKTLPWREMDNHFVFYPTPESDRILINLLAGQDGCQLMLAMVIDNNLLSADQEQCIDQIIGDFSPEGDEFVSVDHGGQNLTVYSFPDLEQIAALEGEQIFTDDRIYPGVKEDDFEFAPHYVSADKILIKSRYGRLLLVDRSSLECVGELILEGCATIGYDISGNPTSTIEETIDYGSEAEQVFLTNAGELFVIHTNGSVLVYRLPDHKFQ